MSGFDDFVADFGEQQEKKKVTPNEVSETFELGQNLINKDYFDEVKNIKILKPFLKGITELNPYKAGYRFQFSASKEYVGLCAVNAHDMVGESKVKKDIYISIKYVKHDANWEQNVRGVILHELSHSLVNLIFEKRAAELHQLDDLHKASAGHGQTFKSICAAIGGAEGCRIFYEKGNLKDSFKKYKYNCTFCGHEGFGDYLNFTDTCSGCDKSIITQSNLE